MLTIGRLLAIGRRMRREHGDFKEQIDARVQAFFFMLECDRVEALCIVGRTMGVNQAGFSRGDEIWFLPSDRCAEAPRRAPQSANDQ